MKGCILDVEDLQLSTQGPAVILVEPQMGENIGAAARAMANFGLSDLRLVAPRDGWPNERAIAAASRADHVIAAAKVFDTLPEAIADLNLVQATTARTRDVKKVVRGPREAVQLLRQRVNAEGVPGAGTGILFGRERWGLTNEEVALADEIVTFPVNPAFASLNIAQAVLLMSYEWMNSGLAEGELPTRVAVQPLDTEPAAKENILGLMQHLETALDPTGYFRTEQKKPAMVQNLRALIQRAGFSEAEVKLLRGVVAALELRHQRPRGSSNG
ncbi:tRNA/rRNA methyltransferase [Faunimonas pinastri]|uniref:tRNA (cytidine/uridine-2'-O-)-methyltransferase TrmJ n=1 Tax=Faunimonas pinastri TaxID=1855383 RepID=A0A1H9D3W9_9HYPH|nr:RNA methyltransferase [Faunimonas pinastri]SEQ08155.1 tRNA/rRNA methyltransferase [Faunimonas pinastri]